MGLEVIRSIKEPPKRRMQLISLTVPVVLMVSDMKLVFLGRRIIHLLLTTMDKHIKDLSPLKEDWQRILRRRECIVKQCANTSKMAMLGR